MRLVAFFLFIIGLVMMITVFVNYPLLLLLGVSTFLMQIAIEMWEK